MCKSNKRQRGHKLKRARDWVHGMFRLFFPRQREERRGNDVIITSNKKKMQSHKIIHRGAIFLRLLIVCMCECGHACATVHGGQRTGRSQPPPSTIWNSTTIELGSRAWQQVASSPEPSPHYPMVKIVKLKGWISLRIPSEMFQRRTVIFHVP